MQRLCVLGALAAAFSCAPGCVARGGGGEESTKGKGPTAGTAQEALPVEAASLVHGPIEATLRGSANLEAESSVAVFARSEGLVRELYVEEGARVDKGELLLRLEDDDQKNQVAKVRSQLDEARRIYERQQRLFSQQLISEQAFSEATYEIEQLEITLDDARRQLAHTEIRAPIGGTVTTRQVDQGDRVQPGAHLFDIVDFNSLVARVYVPEKELGRLRSGLRARVVSQALPGRSFTGQLVRVAPIVDARSGTVKATVAIGWQRGLLPGMYVDVLLITDVHQDALLVPKRALAFDGEVAYVYRIDENDRVERIRIDPLLADQLNVEPAGDVLSAGDSVVTAGQAALKDGALIRTVDSAGSGSGAGTPEENPVEEAAR